MKTMGDVYRDLLAAGRGIGIAEQAALNGMGEEAFAIYGTVLAHAERVRAFEPVAARLITEAVHGSMHGNNPDDVEGTAVEVNPGPALAESEMERDRRVPRGRPVGNLPQNSSSPT